MSDMRTLDRLRTQRLLDIAAVAMFILAAALVALQPHIDFLVPLTTVYAFLSIAVASAALHFHRPPGINIWLTYILAIALPAIGNLVFVLRGTTRDVEYLPVVILYIMAYIVGLFALLQHVHRWTNLRAIEPALDSLMITAAFGVVFAALAAPHWFNNALNSQTRLLAFAYPVMDLLLAFVMARIWFSPAAARVSALRIAGAVPLAYIIEHCASLVILNTSDTQSPWQVTWVFAYAIVVLAVSRPSVSIVEEPEADNDKTAVGLFEALVFATAVATPAILVGVFGMIGRPIPGIPIAIGSALVGLTVAARVTLLMKTLAKRNEEAEHLARSDGLTGAANRRRWDLAMQDAVEEATREGGMFTIALLDLDYFKRFNDTYGHQAGDELLQRAVAAWQLHLPPGNLLARYGGEEFAVLMPGITTYQAFELVERLRAVVPGGNTCSAGIASWHSGESADDIVRVADEALYRAKEGGRNRTVLPMEFTYEGSSIMYSGYEQMADYT